MDQALLTAHNNRLATVRKILERTDLTPAQRDYWTVQLLHFLYFV